MYKINEIDRPHLDLRPKKHHRTLYMVEDKISLFTDTICYSVTSSLSSKIGMRLILGWVSWTKKGAKVKINFCSSKYLVVNVDR